MSITKKRVSALLATSFAPLSFRAKRQQRTSAVGVRRDVYKDMDLKVQYDHFQPGNLSNAFFTNVKPGLAGTRTNVASVVVDFIH